jgi:hypothetical protein
MALNKSRQNTRPNTNKTNSKISGDIKKLLGGGQEYVTHDAFLTSSVRNV